MDTHITVQQLKDSIEKMVSDREWQQFHSPKNLSMDIAIEAGELMEHFLWCDSVDSLKQLEEKRVAVESELADIIIAAIAFANRSHIDIATIVERKVAEISKKYPVELAKGKSNKYTDYKKETQ